MIIFKQILIVSHDEPKADFYRKNLTKEAGWKVSETTTSTTYENTVFYRETTDESSNGI